MGNMVDRLISWLYIHRIWGSRCPDFEPACVCCQKWAEHDEMFS